MQNLSEEKSGHTPGPWVADMNGSVRVQCYPEGLRVDVLSLQLPQQEREANANLIAAAPDTFDVCKALDAFWTEAFPDGPDGPLNYGFGHLSDDTVELWRKCRAAIALVEAR